MKQEILVACQYWADRLDYHVPHTTKETFRHNLALKLASKFQGHWYIDTPHRGQALREILFDPVDRFIDDSLFEAANLSGFNFSEVYNGSHGVRMWVDPGEVEVTFTDAPRRRKVLYQQQSRSLSPPVHYDQSVPTEQNGTVYYYNPECYYQQDCYQYDNPYLYSNENMYYSNAAQYHQPQHQMVEAGM